MDGVKGRELTHMFVLFSIFLLFVEVTLQSYEFILAANGRAVPEDLSPSLLKLGVVPDGYIIHNVTGIRAQIVQRLDGTGYDVRKCENFIVCYIVLFSYAILVGHYTVRPGQVVYINDSSIFLTPGKDVNTAEGELHQRDAEIQLRMFSSDTNPLIQDQDGNHDSQVIDLSLTGYSAHFGADLSRAVTHPPKESPRIRSSEGVTVRRDSENLRGCDSYKQSYSDSVLLVHRGDCTFLEKIIKARDASAAGVIVISNTDMGINPTASRDELALAGDLSDVGLVLLTNQVGQAFENMLVASEQLQHGQIMLALEHTQDGVEDSGQTPVDKETEAKDPNRNLYINGHPLINTRLLI
jgi:ER degradation enhancer, mannosidase alpha-like 1